VTIARSLSNTPSVLLLDEPTGDLDTRNSDLVIQTVVHLNMTEGISIVMVTHDRALINYSHRTIKMLDGKISSIFINPPSNREQAI
jgi:putative ABC transport system ATP-binding protein